MTDEKCGRSCMASYAPPGYGSCGRPKGHDGGCMTAGQIVAARPFSIFAPDMRDWYEFDFTRPAELDFTFRAPSFHARHAFTRETR